MSATDAPTITSAPDALTRYYCAKEREESAVLYINDAYLEAVDALEKLEAENARLREFATETWELLTCNEPVFVWKGLREKARELGVEASE